MKEKIKSFRVIQQLGKYSLLVTGVVLFSAFRPVDEKELMLKTSDPLLQQTFDWAKSMAISHVKSSSDLVGPWYEASLPQREAFCMRDVAHQSGGAEVLSLSKENFNMFFKFAKNISESKDWCTYWEINRYDEPAPIDYRNDKEFWYNLNANFDVLDACYRTYLWTGDRRYIEDDTFGTFYEKTMTSYIERWQLEPEKIMDRPRFMNSPVPFDIEDNYHRNRGLASYVENFEGLTVSADLIATIYRACISYSEILKLKGKEEASKEYVVMAEKYRNLLEDKWWSNAAKSYNTFFTDQKEFHKGEGETFVLWFGATERAERIRTTLGHMLSVDWNVENLSYFPKLLYSYAYNSEAYQKLTMLPTMDRSDYPEVSYGAMEGIVTGLAGIKVDAGKKQVQTLSRLISSTEWVDLQNIPVMEGFVSVRHDHTNKTTFKSHMDYPVIWKATFSGLHEYITCNGKSQKATTELDVLGHSYSYVELEVKPNEQIIVTSK